MKHKCKLKLRDTLFTATAWRFDKNRSWISILEMRAWQECLDGTRLVQRGRRHGRRLVALIRTIDDAVVTPLNVQANACLNKRVPSPNVVKYCKHGCKINAISYRDESTQK